MGIKELLGNVALIVDGVYLVFWIIVWRAVKDSDDHGALVCWMINLVTILNLAALLIR